MSTTFALPILTSGEKLPLTEGIAPFCDIASQNPQIKSIHSCRELRKRFQPNPPNLDQIEILKSQLENLLTKSSTNKPLTNPNRIK